MPHTDTNNRETTCGYIFNNISIKTISTNCRNEKYQIHEGQTNKISVFKNQFFFQRQKQFKHVNIEVWLTIKSGPPKGFLRYFRQLNKGQR